MARAANDPTDDGQAGRSSDFPSTHWSILTRARDFGSGPPQEALGRLAEMYWRPMFSYLRARWKLSDEDAKDVTQDFFVKLSQGEFFGSVREGAGRFRTLVKTCLDNLVRNRHKSDTRRKRGGGMKPLSLDDASVPEPLMPASDDPDDLFRREWRRAILARGFGILEEALKQEGLPHYAELLRQYYFEVPSSEEARYEELAKRNGLTVGDVRNYLARGRRRLRETILMIVRESVTGSESLEAEMMELFGDVM